MNTNFKKMIIVLSIFFVPVLVYLKPAGAGELTAGDVMKKWDNRYDGDFESSKSTMILVDKSGSQRVRQLKTYRKDQGRDKKSIIFFLSPADVRGTSYLSYDWDRPARDDENWLYLPALRKVKRIASNDKSGAFMGSDFTYSDISGMEIAYWNYRFLKKSEFINGFDTWVISGRPKKFKKSKVLKETGYVKVKVWIRKDNHLMVKGKFWVKKGRKIKYFTARDIQKVNGVWTPHMLQMITTKKGKREHFTVIKIWNVNYNKRIGSSMFSVQRMERGL